MISRRTSSFQSQHSLPVSLPLGDSPCNSISNSASSMKKLISRSSSDTGRITMTDLKRKTSSYSNLYTSSSKSGSSTHKMFLLAVVVCFTILVFAAGGHVTNSSLTSKLEELEEARQMLQVDQKHLLAELDSAQKRVETSEVEMNKIVSSVHKQKLNLQRMLAEQKELKQSEASESLQVQQYKSKYNRVKGEYQLVQENIKRMSKQEITERFGWEERHFVEMELRHPDKFRGTETSKIIFELFTKEMPTSVNLFLKQVSSKLWDGKSFGVNPFHVTIAEPFDVNRNDKTRDFIQKNVAYMPFAEYSTEILHLPYTIGFAGRMPELGTAWYVNKHDNSDSHGPKILDDRDIHGEPCFGQILVGKDLIDTIGHQDNNQNDTDMLEKPIEIVSARIISKIDAEEFSKLIRGRNGR